MKELLWFVKYIDHDVHDLIDNYILQRKIKWNNSEINYKLETVKMNMKLTNRWNDLHMLEIEHCLKYSNSSIDLKSLHLENSIVTYSRDFLGVNLIFMFMKRFLTAMNNDNYSYLNWMISNEISVNIIDYTNINHFLDPITKNIVFCDYIDCLASDTIVECISTNAPIILDLDRHLAVVEYLGENYSLYDDLICNKKTDNYYLNNWECL